LPITYYDTHTTGTLMSKVTNDVIGLQAAATTSLNALVRGVFSRMMSVRKAGSRKPERSPSAEASTSSVKRH